MYKRFNLDDEVYVWRMERFGNKNTVWRGSIKYIDPEDQYVTVSVYPESLVEELITANSTDQVYLLEDFDMNLGVKDYETLQKIWALETGS
jgi:hypothetical protein